jgi:hypothetical protein
MAYQDPGEKPWGPYQGMTVNERLFVAGQLEAFDRAAAERNSEEMIAILTQVDITASHAQRVVTAILDNPKMYVY